MVSRNPDELAAEIRELDVVVDEETLDVIREEARDTVDAQIDMLGEIDSKASKLIRLNFVILGILVSVLSILSQNGSGGSVAWTIETYVNVYMKGGVTALIFSTVAAAITFSVSDIDVGVDHERLRIFLETPISTTDAKRFLVLSHIMRINWNRSENVRAIPLLQASILLVVASMTLFSIGIFQLSAGYVPNWLSGTVLCSYLCLAWLVDFHTQVQDGVADLLEWRR